MPRLTRNPVINGWTFRGVDDWLCFVTDRDGKWYAFVTECAPEWRHLPDCFIGDCGYPDTAEGVLATAILMAEAGRWPTDAYTRDPECVAELERLLPLRVCDRCGIAKTSGHLCGTCGEDV